MEGDRRLFVAVSKEIEESWSTLNWALQNSGGKNIWILHVHTPSQITPGSSRRGNREVIMARQMEEKEEMLKALEIYIKLCADNGAKAELIVFEAECIEKGIVDLISKKSITALVMGASADNRYRAGMSQLRSKKWLYVMSEAPAFCHICFVCNGNLIRCWEGVLRHADPDQERGERRSPHHLPGKSLGNDLYDIIEKLMAKVDTLRIAEKESTDEATRKHAEVLQELRDVVTQNEKYKKEIDNMEIELDIFKTQNDEYKKEVDDLDIELAKAETRNYEYKKELDDLEIELAKVETQNDKYKKEIDELEFKMENVIETRNNEHEVKLFNLYIELDNVKTQNKEYKKKLDDLYIKLNNVETHNKEHEEELDDLYIEQDDLYIELNNVKTQNKVYEEERGDLETKLNNALLEIDLLMKQLAQYEHTAPRVSRFFADFTYLEILEATDHFSSSRKIGEGGYGNTYKGLLRRTEVAIKVLSSDSLQGPREFRQEADTLSRLRHPNIVTLIGVCSENSSLIYEYLPNGSLEDRLSCKNNTPPLTWQTRTCIAAELCSALMFMHSCQPKSIIHGDLKPANILLDAHLSCKLGDFGICRAVKATMFYKTHHPKGTFAYMDPEFTSTGELTPKSDVYSFGVILLQLLTGKPPLGIIHQVQNALGNGTLKAVLDPSAGDWPYLQANQLARLGLRCCDRQRTNRPDLQVGAWRVLEPMRISAGSSPLSNLVPPPYFMCPIVQDVMQDPQVAADGFTYEGEALRGWLDSGHDTSPMTNLILENQTLIPNRALRSAIQDWLQPR